MSNIHFCLSLLAFWLILLSSFVEAQPSVVAVRPSDGAVDVFLHVPGIVEIQFSEPMDQDSVMIAMEMQPDHPLRGWKIDQAYQWKDARTLSFIRPGNTDMTDSLSPGQHYTVTVNTNAKSVTGRALKETHAWKFTTKRGDVRHRINYSRLGKPLSSARHCIELSKSAAESINRVLAS